jgi:hypothetical protein
MRMTCHAKVAQRKGNVIGKKWTRDNVVRGTLKGQKFGRRRHLKPECKYGIRNRCVRQQLQSEREFTKIYRKTAGLEIVKRIARSTVGLRTIRNWTLWRGQPLPKWKEDLLALLA